MKIILLIEMKAFNILRTRCCLLSSESRRAEESVHAACNAGLK